MHKSWYLYEFWIQLEMEGRVSAAQTSGPYKAYELSVTF